MWGGAGGGGVNWGVCVLGGGGGEVVVNGVRPWKRKKKLPVQNVLVLENIFNKLLKSVTRPARNVSRCFSIDSVAISP